MAHIFREYNPEKVEQVRNHPYYAKLRNDTIEQAERFLVNEPSVIKFSKIHLYVTTGNREQFEKVYTDYEVRMTTYALAYIITEEEKYIEALADIIWNICDFESWSIPAHVSETLSTVRRRQNLDLTSCIMGYRMSEILYLLGDKMPELVVRRARDEIRYRIVDSFETYTDKEFSWYNKIDNWSAVCIAGVLCTYLYTCTDEQINTQIPKMREIAENYLKGFADDGCCTEGYGYWIYGFSFFCLFAKMLCDYTDGEINYFADEKVHKIAMFQQNILLNERECISFSDGNLEFEPRVWLSHFLKGMYPDMQLPALPEQFVETIGNTRLRFVFSSNPDIKGGEIKPISHIFHDAEWFLCHTNSYALGAKAGHNKEFHNHNDVGSFIISKNGKVTFCDPGAGEYTADYFSSNRYNIFLPSARAHSVPIINGQYQIVGERKGGVITAEERRFKFHMDNGYFIDTLASLVRDFECLDEYVRLTDEYEFTEQPTSISERFVSLLPIALGDGELHCGDSVMTFDKNAFDVTISEEIVPRKHGKKDTVYYADLTAKVLDKKIKFVFEFK